MIEFFRKLLGSGKQPSDPASAAQPNPPPRTAKRQAKSAPQPTVKLDVRLDGKVDDLGPGKNVLIRKKYVREDTGTHETLKILDDSAVDSGEETGIDPYNTGNFDRSRNWDKRFRN